MDDEFEKITSNTETAEGSSGSLEFESMMEVLEHYWSLFYPGSIFTKGIIIAEAVYPQGKVLRHFSESTEWDTLGMLECMKMQIQASNVDEVLNFSVSPNDDEDSEDDEE